jgi:pimeloyl-ACP methyl ester carboxylesterase
MKPNKSMMALTTFMTVVTVAGLVNVYRSWRRQQLVRLRSTSSLLETARGPIEYCMWGEGPAVLLLHGTPGGYDQSLAVSRLIGSRNSTFIAISRPGYLRTPLEVARTPEEQADLYVDLLDTLHIDRAAVIGISGGGPSALLFALRYPERCRGLVMISGVTQHYSEEELRARWSLTHRLLNKLYGNLIICDPLLSALVPLARLRASHLHTEELLNSVMFYRLRKLGTLNDLEQFAAISTYPLEQIAVLMLAIHGRADKEVPYAHAELLARSVPQMKMLSIEDGGHMAFYTHFDLVMPEIKAFLETLPS